MTRGRVLLVGLLAFSLGAASWLARTWLLPRLAPTATPEIIADCFWSADVFAWEDADGDGERDEGEPPLEGVEVNFSLTFLSGATTGTDGRAHVGGMHPGTCDIGIENSVVARAPEGYEATTALVVAYTAEQVVYEFGFRPAP